MSRHDLVRGRSGRGTASLAANAFASLVFASLLLPGQAVRAQVPPAATGATPATASTPEATASAPLGRLFLTPERRLALERQRQLNLRESRSDVGETLQLNGVVQRSSGRRSVWINNQMTHENDGAISADINPRNPSSAGIRTGNDATTRLRVGESINRSTRERSDVVTPNAVRTGKPGSQ